MLAFVLRRLIQAVVVMLTVAFIAFMLFQYVGDPVASMLGQDATPEQRELLRAELGLDKPFPVQFARFVGNALQGDFGISLRQESNEIALVVSDDGAGLDLEKLRRKGQEMGLLPAEGEPTEAQLAQLIFVSGLSTAEAVSGNSRCDRRCMAGCSGSICRTNAPSPPASRWSNSPTWPTWRSSSKCSPPTPCGSGRARR